MTQTDESFFRLFQDGDVAEAERLFAQHTDLTPQSGLHVHPLLRRFASDHPRHVYRTAHVQMAERLIPELVRSFRDAVCENHLDDTKSALSAERGLANCEFLTTRGITQPLHCVTSCELAEVLIDGHAQLNSLTSRGDSPLTVQLRSGRVDVARLLLERGADPNSGTGFHIPSKSLDVLVELLLEHGWDINNAPMLHDANHGHAKRVVAWLSRGADPNVRTSAGRTTLHVLAARGSGREAVRALVDAGADVHAKDNAGMTALALARSAGASAIVSQLVELGAKD